MPKGATKAQTKDQLHACEEVVAKGTFLPTKEVPKFSKVAAEWLEYKKAKIRETAWEVYEGHVRNHFDDLNDLLINRFTIATVEKFITDRITQEVACRLENAVFGAVGHHLGTKKEKGLRSKSVTPLIFLVGGTGFEPVTSTV
jgi:hypothetical protein